MFAKAFTQILLAVVLVFSSFPTYNAYEVTTSVSVVTNSTENTCETQDFTPSILIGNLYYYNQLNDAEKRLYDDLINSTGKFFKGEDITLTLCSYDAKDKKSYLEYYYFVKRVIKAYTYDNPEAVVWFENYNRTYYIADNKDYVYMKLTPKTSAEATSNLNASNIEKELTALHNTAKDFVKTLTGTDSEKVEQINKWIIDKVSYDETISLPDRDNIYGPLMKDEAICSGYSYAFKYLADLAGLDVIYVTGKAYDSTNNTFIPHAWNLACVDGNWLLVDVTFNDSAGTKYLLINPKDDIHFLDTAYKFTYPK